MNGWIRLDRALLDHMIWSAKYEPFTKGQAWVDILLSANYKRSFFFVRGAKVSLERGQLGWSQVTMAGRWGWSRKKVNLFLKTLEEEQMVTLQATQQTTIITVCNYSKYQDLESEGLQQKVQQRSSRGYNRGAAEGTTDDPQLNNITSKQGNKRRGFTAPTLAEVNSYLSEKGCKDQKIGAAFHNYFESVGWMRGNTKMRDWKAAARNWYAKEQDMRGTRSENVVEIDPRKARAKEAISAELKELMKGHEDDYHSD